MVMSWLLSALDAPDAVIGAPAPVREAILAARLDEVQRP
jgi:hypothetical protein